MKTVNDVHQFLKGKTFWLSTVDSEGKLKFFPLVFDLQTEELLGDVYKLIDFRKSLK